MTILLLAGPDRPLSRIRFAAAVVAAVLVAGCQAANDPRFAGGGGPLPLKIVNHTDHTVDIVVRLLEPQGASVLTNRTFHLPPGGWSLFAPVEIPYGEYVLRASTDALAREVPLHFQKDTISYRLLVEPEAIAFQNG